MADFSFLKTYIEEQFPFTHKCGIKVVEIGEGRSVVALPPDDTNMNHLGSVHAGALFTLAETTSGVCVASAVDFTRLVPIVKEGRCKYKKLARGVITGSAEWPEAARAPVIAEAEREGKANFTLRFELKNEAGELVAECEFTNQIRKQE
jgi:uncharacterized protein (TIGR00369 family)